MAVGHDSEKITAITLKSNLVQCQLIVYNESELPHEAHQRSKDTCSAFIATPSNSKPCALLLSWSQKGRSGFYCSDTLLIEQIVSLLESTATSDIVHRWGRVTGNDFLNLDSVLFACLGIGGQGSFPEMEKENMR